MNIEKSLKPLNGYVALVIFLIFILLGVVLLRIYVGAFLLFVAVLMIPGFVLVNPNSSRVLLLFGKYIGTIKQNGLFWVNPLYSKKKISLRASNFDSERLKVNYKLGNPVMISTILVWRVTDT